jgi:protein-disulfide isomerase
VLEEVKPHAMENTLMMSRRLCKIALGIALAVVGATPAHAEKTGRALDRAVLETAIHDYLLKNPAVVREALQALEAQEKQASAQRAQEALRKNQDALLADAGAPVGGNPQGDVTVVAFFDYRCPHCKRAELALQELVAQDPNVRIVYKEFPILGPDSLLAARSALAASRQGKYAEFHKALMAADTVDAATIDRIVGEVGLDPARLMTDRDDAATGEIIDRSYRLTGELNIGGTPAFVVGERLIPGAADLASLMGAVSVERLRQQIAHNSAKN